VSGTVDWKVKVWDVATGKCVATLKGHPEGVTDVAMFPDGRRVVFGSLATPLEVWDVETGECVATLEGHSRIVWCVAVFPDGRRVVSGSFGEIKVWENVAGQKQMFEVHVPQGVRPRQTFALTANGKRVEVKCPKNARPGEKMRFQLETGWKCVATLKGHSDDVKCVAVFPDGRRVVSGDGPYGSGPGVLKVWNIETGKCVATLEGHWNAGPVRCAASTVLL